MKPIFLYLKSCKLSDRQLKKLTNAGYVTLAVESFDSVRISAEPLVLTGSDPIAIASFQAIAASNWQSVQADFGTKVARALSVRKP